MAHADPGVVATVYTAVAFLSVTLGSWLYDAMRKCRPELFRRLEGDLRVSAALTVIALLIAPLYVLLFDVRHSLDPASISVFASAYLLIGFAARTGFLRRIAGSAQEAGYSWLIHPIGADGWRASRDQTRLLTSHRR